MSVAQATDPNDPGREFVDFWNEILVPKFIRYKHILVDGLTHHSEAIFPALPVKAGDRVLDAGCGFGDTAIKLARRVGPAGAVTGIDCCDGFLEIARRDAGETGLANLAFVEGDVQSYGFEPVHDFVFSRFGTMFFQNPVQGLRNMRTALKPGGVMTMIVWRTMADNPWLGLPKEIILRFLPPSGEGARTCGPGPFSMADQAMVGAMLKSAGYQGAEFRRVDAPVLVGRTARDSMDFQLALGPAGEVFREAGDLAEQRRAEIEQALSDELSGYVTEEGVVMASSSWVITARNPE